MKLICDFHIHSKYSRATSKKMDIVNLVKYAKKKGINILGTGDFTHPLWLSELKENLLLSEEGLFKYNDIYFVLTTEVCNIFTVNNQIKKIHNIIFAPDFETVEKINQKLVRFGHLSLDGRPILHLSAKNLVNLIFEISENCLIVPAHIWTPWFSLFGAHSGFDYIEECFEEETKNIFCLETGLSSDPAMNWRLSCLDKYNLISNSDAHSPSKLGREANILEVPLNYFKILAALKQKDKEKFLLTCEFFPEEGKYHYDGHRKCEICLSPEESLKYNNRCPKCGGFLTIGVMHRIMSLSDRKQGYKPTYNIPYKNLIPLEEIIAQVINTGIQTLAVEKEYIKLIQTFGSEFNVLLNVEENDLKQVVSEAIANAIIKVRIGNVKILPGFDGVFGQIKIVDEKDKEETVSDQLSLF